MTRFRSALTSPCNGRNLALLGTMIFVSLQQAAAVNVSLELDLIEPADPINVLTVTLGSGFPVGRDTETSNLTGSLMADLGLDLTTATPVPTELTFLGGLVEATDASFKLLLGSLTATTMDLGGSVSTPMPPGSVSDGMFDASEHLFTVNQGTVEAAGESLDFGEQSIEANGIGFGSVELIPVGSVEDNLAMFDVRVELPVMIDETVPIDGIPIVGSIDLDIDASGVFVSQDRITIELPQLLACDSDLDADVDSADRTRQAANWTGALLPGSGDRLPGDGDCDLDRDVDAADVTLLVTEWSGAQMAVADFPVLTADAGALAGIVPEPTSSVSLLLGGLWFAHCLRRRAVNAMPSRSV